MPLAVRLEERELGGKYIHLNADVDIITLPIHAPGVHNSVWRRRHALITAESHCFDVVSSVKG